MRANKHVFWFSSLLFLISVLFVILSVIYTPCNQTLWTILQNVFISVGGGALLSMATSYVSFKRIEKQQLLRFSGEFIKVENLIKRLYNSFAWDFDSIKYTTIKEIPEEITDIEERLRIYGKNYEENSKIVEKFFSKIESITEYEYTTMHEILDDFCGLINSDPKVRKQMQIMMTELSKYNIVYSKLIKGYTLYRERQYDAYMFFYQVLVPMKDKLQKDGLDVLSDEHRMFVKLAKISKYLKKLYKDRNL